ncbi:MAG: M20/M25/M40 family metallo-hydrolase [Acidobacteriota bacterium]
MTRHLFRLGLGVCLAIALIIPVVAGPTSIRVDGTIIKGYITHLASDQQEGRRTLTPGYERMADWAAAQLMQWGLKPAGENGTFFQAVPMTGARASFTWTTGVPSLTVGGRSFYVREGDFTVDGRSSARAEAQSDVVFVGYGISAPAKGLDEYAGVDVRGKIVLALRGSPTSAPDIRPGMGSTPRTDSGQAAAPKEEWAEESADLKKAAVASEKGAAALLLYTPPAPAGTATGRGGVGPAAFGGGRGGAEPQRFGKPFIFVSNVSDAVFRAVMWRDPQESARGFDARLARIRADIKNRKPHSGRTGVIARVKGYTSVTNYSEALKNNIGRNVIAKIEGTDPTLKGQYVIMGGHLDHTGMRDGVVFNGADDNASGAAVTLEVARLLAVNRVQPKRTIIFCLWTGEEQGLLGSRYYVQHPTDGVKMDSVVTYFNMDMVGLGERIGAPGALNFPEIWKVITRDQDADVIAAVDPSTGGPGGSDHSAFIELGIEALALMTAGAAGHPDYHDAGDDPAKIEPEILRKTGQFVLQGALNLANETQVDLLIPSRQTLYQALRFSVPDMVGGTQRGWQSVRATTHDELLGLVAERFRLLQAGTQTGRGGMSGRGGATSRVASGIRDASVFQGSSCLMDLAVLTLGIGRVDVVGGDGVWFGDTVSTAGREALKIMEAGNIVLNLVRPSASLVASVLDAATKPILITAPPVMDAALVEKFKKNRAAAAIACEVNDVAGCVQQLEAVKGWLGKENLLLSMGAGEDRDEATKTLYMGLVKAGWSAADINAMVGIGTPGEMGRATPGNLARFVPAAAGRGGN